MESKKSDENHSSDFKVTHTKSNLIQGNEYYPFGLQTANSWTRESVTGNRYLANGGTEMNSTTQLYDLEFRNYDPALGRMYGVDPVAAKYASLTPYNYSFNNPVGFSDPSGADPEDLTNTPPANAYYFHNGAGAAGYPGLTYDDWIPQNTRGEYNNAFGWRTDFALGWFGGTAHWGQGYTAAWTEAYSRMYSDSQTMSPQEFAEEYGKTFGGGIEGLKAGLGEFGIRLQGEFTPTIASLGGPESLGPQTTYVDEKALKYLPKGFSKKLAKNVDWVLDEAEEETKPNGPMRIPSIADGTATKSSRIKVYVHPSILKKTDDHMRIAFGHEWKHIDDVRSGKFELWIQKHGLENARFLIEERGHDWGFRQDKNPVQISDHYWRDYYRDRLNENRVPWWKY